VLDRLTYLITSPQAIIYAVATALLYPVLFTEVAALAITLVEAGRFTVESVVRWRHPRSLTRIEGASRTARLQSDAGDDTSALATLSGASDTGLLASYLERVREGADLSPTRLSKCLADVEFQASRRLEFTRVLVRIGPMLGLMGTLIPISPALVALAEGDVQTLSDNLVVAFSTTVVGLLIGGIAYVITAIRDRRYLQDISDAEYLTDVFLP